MTTRSFFLCSVFLAASVLPAKADRNLDLEKAEKMEIRDSMLGFRNTLLFYLFKEEKAILTLTVDNKDESFPVTGKILLFDPSTTEKGMKRWINNQHSDGLYAEVPTPTFTKDIPADAVKVTSFERKGEKRNPSGEAMFGDYEVTFAIEKQAEEGKFVLNKFTDQAQVFVRKK